MIGGLDMLEAGKRQNERLAAYPPIGIGENHAFEIFAAVAVLFFLHLVPAHAPRRVPREAPRRVARPHASGRPTGTFQEGEGELPGIRPERRS